MNRYNKKGSLTFACLLFALSSLVSLSACNSTSTGGDTSTTEPTTEQTEPTTGEQSEQQSQTQETATGDTGDTPITVGLEDSDRQGTDPLQLLENEQIKKELNITEEQTAKLNELEGQLRADLQKTVSGLKLNELPEDQREAKLKEVSEEIDQKLQDSREQIGEVLTPEQLTRAKQIFLQVYGWGVLTKDDFTEELKLTDEQQKELDDLRDQLAENMRANWEVPPSDDPAARNKVIAENTKRMEQIIKESNDKALAVLTPEQQQTLETLKGEKFELDPTTLPSQPQ